MFTMKDASFAEILEEMTLENDSFSSDVDSLQTIETQTLEPAYLAYLQGILGRSMSGLNTHNHLASAYFREQKRKPQNASEKFYLKSEGMTHQQFKAYEFLLYALELPILKAHSLFPESFSLGQLKKAYKLAALKNHPDQGGSHESFLELRKCYDILEGFAKTKPS